MKNYYITEGGKGLVYGEEDDVNKNHPTAVRVNDKPSDDYKWKFDTQEWVIDNKKYLEKRRKEYPSDRLLLKAIIAQFTLMQSNGVKMCNEMFDFLSLIDQINLKYPKQ